MVGRRRFLSLDCTSIRSSAELVVELSPTTITSVILELTLLLAGLADSLRLAPTDGPAIIVTLTSDNRTSKAAAIQSGDG